MKDQKDFWGPKLWKLIHTISYYAPAQLSEIQKKNYYYFYTFLVPRCIMCLKCQLHYRRMMEKFQFDGSTRDELINYSIELHNRVNRRLRKQQLTRNDVDQIYRNKSVYIKEIYNLIIWYKGNVQYGSFTKNNFQLLLIYLTKLLPYINITAGESDKENLKKNIDNRRITDKMEDNFQDNWKHPTNKKLNDRKIINI